MATPAEEILRAVETLQGLLGPGTEDVLNPATKTALQIALPGVRQAASIGTAQGRSTIKLGEQQATENIRVAREGRKRIEKEVATARVRLEKAADTFGTAKFSGNARRSLVQARENFVRLGGIPAVADAFIEEATEKRRAKFTGEQRELRLKRKTPQNRALRIKTALAADAEASRTAQAGKLSRLGFSGATKLPGGGTLEGLMGKPADFKQGLRKVQGRRSLVKGGLIGGAAAIGIPLLLKMFGGGQKDAVSEIPPEIQMQLMQSLGGGRGGVDPAIGTGRDLRNVFKLLQIIKTLTDMQGVQAQPGMGALV